MEPLYQNLLATLAVITFVKTVVGTCDYAVSKKWISSSVSRKITHIAAGSWIMFWPLFSIDHWTWRLNVFPSVAYSLSLFIKGAILKDPNDVDVKMFSRSGDPSELLEGPLLFSLVASTVGLFCFGQETAVVIMACLGFGN